jgi:pimeloyl-ACP methyl ester carboxylesterase
MKRLTAFEAAPQTQVASVKPAWQCAAWGCTIARGIVDGSIAYCRYHYGKDTGAFDAISDLVNKEAWRLRLVRCAQSAPSGWRDTCKSLAHKYGRNDLDPFVLDMSEADSARYEHLVYADMDDALREPVARAAQNVPVTIRNGEDRPVTPMDLIRRYRDSKRAKA